MDRDLLLSVLRQMGANPGTLNPNLSDDDLMWMIKQLRGDSPDVLEGIGVGTGRGRPEKGGALARIPRQRGRAAPPSSGETFYGNYERDLPATTPRKKVNAKVLDAEILDAESRVVGGGKAASRAARAARVAAPRGLGGAGAAAAGGAASLLAGVSWPLALAFILPSLMGTGADIWKTSQEIGLAKKQMGNESLANALLVQQQANREERDRGEAIADKERQRQMLREMMNRQGYENQANRIAGLLGQGQSDRMNLAASGMQTPVYQDLAMLSGQDKPSVWESLGIE